MRTNKGLIAAAMAMAVALSAALALLLLVGGDVDFDEWPRAPSDRATELDRGGADADRTRPARRGSLRILAADGIDLAGSATPALPPLAVSFPPAAPPVRDRERRRGRTRVRRPPEGGAEPRLPQVPEGPVLAPEPRPAPSPLYRRPAARYRPAPPVRRKHARRLAATPGARRGDRRGHRRRQRRGRMIGILARSARGSHGRRGR